MAAKDGSRDAFAVLMSAGRKQQQQSPHNSSKQQRKRPSSSSSSPSTQHQKRQCSAPGGSSSQPTASQVTDSSQQQSQPPQLQQQQQPVPPLSSIQGRADGDVRPASQGGTAAAAAAGASTPKAAAAADKQAAVAAFKRAFSGGLSRPPARQRFDYLLVYDLEATTNKARTLHPVEIIELSCVIIHTASASIRASFQSYVRPTEHPRLDPFVTELCGIEQSQVDGAPLLADVLQQHHAWLQQQGVLDEGVSCIPVTWTDWDLKVALCTECGWRRIQRPDYLCRWTDLKQYFRAKYKKSGNLKKCVESAGLVWTGRAHSGIDDATNTANLAIHLMRQGVTFEVSQVSENPNVNACQGRAAHAGFGSAAAAAGAGAAAEGGGDAQPSIAGGQQGAGSRGQPCSSMAQKAAQRGVSGVFDASGKWLGRCFCGAKAKSRVTKRPGPNHGRAFWSCGCWTITAQQSSSCEFFLWADEVPGSSHASAG